MPAGLFLCNFFRRPCRMRLGLLLSFRGNVLLFLLEWSNVRYGRVVVLHCVLAGTIRLGLVLSQLRRRYVLERRYGDSMHGVPERPNVNRRRIVVHRDLVRGGKILVGLVLRQLHSWDDLERRHGDIVHIV